MIAEPRSPDGFDRVGSLFLPSRKMPIPQPGRRLGIIAGRDRPGGGTPKLFPIVALGSTGGAYWSVDAINWTAGTGLPAGITCVCWAKELGLFIAAGTTGHGATSPDGQVWTSTNMATRGGISRVAWSGSIAVAVSGQLENSLSTSDGSTWVDNTLSGHTGYSSIAWLKSKGVFSIGQVSGLAYGWAISDAVAWTFQFPMPGGSPGSSLEIVDGGAGKPAIAVGNSGTNRGLSSTDGKTWAVMTAPGFPAANYASVAAGGGIIVAVTSDGSSGGAQVSSDGSTWNQGTLASGSWNQVTFSPSLGLFVVVGTGAKIGRSSDGITWQTVSNAAFSFVAVAASN